MRLFLIRHGQTDWNLKGRIQGSKDLELNTTGIEQAKKLSRIVQSKLIFSRIYSSKQKRALQTAKIMSEITSI